MVNTEQIRHKNIRLKNYDYSQNGFYFVTICTQNKQNTLCSIVGSADHGRPFVPEICYTETGKIVLTHINNINIVYTNVKLDSYIVMPNHIHLMIALNNNPYNTETTIISIPKIINSLKTITSKKIGCSIWQKNYYEHIIRCEQEINEIRQYIQNNPLNWRRDMFYKL